MNPELKIDRQIESRVRSRDSGGWVTSAKTLADGLSRYFPPPPADILVGGVDAVRCGDSLVKLGYRVTRTNFFDANLRNGLSNGYDGVFLAGEPGEAAGLASLVNDIRHLLKPGGMVVVGKAPYGRNNSPGAQADENSRQLITSLYENGFSVQANEPPMTIARKTSIFLRPYRQSDEVGILEMFQQVFNAQRTFDHWCWKFRDNPFGAYKIVQAADQGGILAGHYSGYPVPFYAPAKGGESFLSLQIGDIMTRPGFRNVGLGKTSVLGRITDYFHHRFCIDQIPFMYGFVAGNHRKFGERFLHYRYMPSIPYHVLDFGHGKMRKPGRFKQILSGVRVTEIPQVTPDFDHFFKKAAKDYGMLVRRDATYLKWRYMDCPDGGYRFFVVKHFGKLVGWSVFKERGTVLLWGDALFLKDHLHLVETLIAEVIGNHFQSVLRVEGWFSKTPQWWSAMLLNMGFDISEEPNGLVGGVTLFDPFMSAEFVADHLYYTMGDSDLF